jgi:hypothetical protein
MAAGTIYLDVDDEITSAAARIRSSESPKVSLVVPYGSRISTSRMNFRLLSREAVVNNRRLSIIAADPATRALAASAGLPVFATVGEYESAVAGPPAAESGDEPPTASPPPGDEDAIPQAEVAAPPPPAKRRSRRSTASDETQAVVLPPAAAVAVPTPPPPNAAAPAVSDRFRPDGPTSATRSSGGPPVRGATRPFRIGTPVILALGVAILALAVLGVGAYLVLPAADITVTPREEPIGPIPLTITADPDAPSVDPASDVVPAVRLEVPVDVSETFTTTGKRTELVAAKGTVTFRNVDFTSTNTIPAGSIVSTEGGIKFSTDRAVTVPRATLVNLTVVPSFADVDVTAAKKGTAGNVEPNTITVIPPGEDPVTLTVRNQQPTAGGARNEFPKVSQEEVDQAVAGLRTKLEDAFGAAVAAGAGAPEGTTLFPETAVLGESTPSVDPASLVGQEIATFDLGMSANGTVIAVDASPVATIAESRLLANVGAGYRLVEGSDTVDPGEPVVSDGVVTFPVSARAARVKILDPEALRALVKGQSVEQARALLEPYGEVEIHTWPGWVNSITGFDSRVTVTIGGQTGEAAGSSAAPSSNAASKAPATPAASETTVAPADESATP